MLRGFQAANEHAKGALLRDVLATHPDNVYAGLLTVLLRLVFLLFAEDRGLMPTSGLYVRYYSVHGLFEQLRADYERYPDTMDQRYGAWARLLALFHAVYAGCRHPQLKIPARKGYLFDPGRYRFLESSSPSPAVSGEGRGEGSVPLVSDGVVFRVLRNLLLLEGERLSYRTLDVEEIGSVYQTIMGFRLEVVGGPSIAVAGKRKHKGEVPAPNAINLEELLAAKPTDRVKWLRERTDQDVTGEAERKLKAAATLDDLLAALERKTARNATPHVVPCGALILQPTDERRRSGSHYTPRSFTEPIVHTTLRPILQRLSEHPTPEQILDLKICDLAVGSAAFLVETCRQLGDELVDAWHHHGQVPFIPPDEDEVLHARRLVAQRCLYGVDRNPMAVDLAKLSLWLATLARDHPFTFLDHAIRCGDSLAGLTRKQLADFDWRDEPRRVLGQELIEKRIRAATAYRKEILDADEFVSPDLKQQKLDLADEALTPVRRAGDSVIAAFFSAEKDRDRQARRNELLQAYTAPVSDLKAFDKIEAALVDLHDGPFPMRPFHWEIQFPEVFDRENGGFDGIVGNPPFVSGSKISSICGHPYLDWLKILHEESHGNGDLVAHFFRRAFNLLRVNGCFGLIATNTIGQGDTRQTGLRWICTHGGTLYSARRRSKWPGQAAVVVSIVHAAKGPMEGPFDLDYRKVPRITAYLFHTGGNDDPLRLPGMASRCFSGSKVNGEGFVLEEKAMRDWIDRNPRNADVILPYMVGSELNDTPHLQPNRFVICFREWTLNRASAWPELVEHLRRTVKSQRAGNRRARIAQLWWQFEHYRSELYESVAGLPRVLVLASIVRRKSLYL